MISRAEQTSLAGEHMLMPGDEVEIGRRGAETFGFRQFGRFQTIAELELGGGYSNGVREPQKIFLLRVVDKKDDDYRNLMRRAKLAGEAYDADYVFAAVGDEEQGGSVLAMAPMLNRPTTGLGGRSNEVLGREGNIVWFDYGPVGPESGGVTKPAFMRDNHTISRHQADAVISERGVTFNGVSDRSKTVIKAPDIRVIRLGGQEPTVEHVPTPRIADQKPKAAGRFAKLLGRKRDSL